MKYIKIAHLALLAVIALSFSACEEDKDPKQAEFKLPSQEIRKIEIDGNGVKWIATAKGLVKLDDKEWTVFKDNELLTQTPIEELAFSNASGKNELWLGSSKGVSWFDYTADLVNPMTTYRAQEGGLLDDNVSAIDIDSQNVKYIGTSKGLSILKETKWVQFMGSRNEEILSTYKISAIATAADGHIYAATEGGGVTSFKYTDAVSGATTFHQPWSADLMSDTVYTVIVVDENHQWYGTNRGAALHTSAYAKADWTPYTRLDGLICDSVYAIGKDTKGQVWFGTHKGVSMLKDTTWQSFTTKEGLIDNKINTLAVDKDGSVWFGTDKGISHYNNGQWINY
ncbi:MAG TPA: two-component regulator propeller domain-containing protein [Prolixibacteraceae bacterium]|nr:two-component regulator propeller domain-containing protein [Prolixibacteraceae bacterium]